MPSIDDVYNQIVATNTNLQQMDTDITASVDAVKASTDSVKASVDEAVHLLSTLTSSQATTNQMLVYLAQQMATAICNLEKITKQTCALLNEAHTQTGLQTTVQESAVTLVKLYELSHAHAAVEQERFDRLQRRIEVCCPPEKAKPICVYEACKAPGPLSTQAGTQNEMRGTNPR